MLLLALPLGWLPGASEPGALWAVSVALAIGSVVAGRKNLAIWCGLFAAMAVLFQPLFPVALGRFERWVEFGAAAIIAVCVVRKWE